MQTFRNNQHIDKASFLLLHCMPHSPTVHILSLSQSMSSPLWSSESFICAVSLTLVVTMQRQSILARQKRSSQPMLKFIPTNITTGGKKKQKDGEKDTNVKKPGGKIKKGRVC